MTRKRTIRLHALGALAASALLVTACGERDGDVAATKGVDATPKPAAADTATPPKATSEPEPAKPTSEPEPAKPTADTGAAILAALTYYAKCGGEVKSMADVLAPITEKMHAQNIPYAQSPANEWRDCSGNFLRLSSYVAAACPGNEGNLAAPPGVTDYPNAGGNKAPGGEKARETRTLAKWYHEQGRFIPIYYDGVTDISAAPQDLIDNRNRIKPGAVLWFSRKMPTKEGGLQALFNQGSSGTHINHMSTVRAATFGADGLATEFEMYHGRSPGKNGAITKTHYWDWPATYTSKGQKYPPFGYWSQFLVGIGTLLPAEPPPATLPP